MDADNDAEFEKQVLRAISALYAAHPRTIILGSEITLVPPPTKGDPDYEDRMAFSSGTIYWLHRNGIVTGNLTETTYRAILGAQLSTRAYLILRSRDAAVPDSTLGQAAERCAADPGSRDESAVAELIVRKLS